MSALIKSKYRNGVLAGGVAVIVAIGTYTGASLKTETEKKQIKQEFLAEPVEQQLARLENEKLRWMRMRQELVKKIESLDRKREAGKEV